MVNYIREVDESFFIETKKILDNYSNILDIRLAGSIVRNKKLKVGDFDVGIYLKNSLNDISEIKDDILNLQKDYYPKLDIMFFNHKVFNSVLNGLKTLNKSSYDELITYPYFSTKEKKCVNFKYGDKYKPYTKLPFLCFMVPVAIEVNKWQTI